jgi:integrase
MRRRSYQKPRIKNKGGYWIAQFRDLHGKKRKVSLGPANKTKKIEAQHKLDRLLEPINHRLSEPTSDLRFGEFVRQMFLPFYRRKWKNSTIGSNENRLDKHLQSIFADRPLASFTRDELQRFLDQKAADALSHSMVAHLRWDLRQIFRMAVAEGCILRNPAELLFVPRGARRFPKPRLTLEQVRLLFSVLDLRERVIAGFAILSGMRPGEIFALRRGQVENGYAEITQRIYQGKFDTPKTFHSQRCAALGDGLSIWLRQWLESLPFDSPEALLFPSERKVTPVAVGNCWKRHFRPRLKTVGLDWVNFQVMRRTHSTLLYELDVDPQVRAEQMGHTVDVNQNQYTRASLERRRAAVNLLEKTLGVA